MLRRIVASTLYNPDLGTPSGARRLTVRGNQALFEHGLRPPWVWTAQQCRDYWATRTDGTDANQPANYTQKNTAIVDLLHEFWQPEVTTGMSVCEIGSNAGPNLNRLHELGYSDLSGVEINPHAIRQMRATYPALEGVPVTEGPLEQALPAMAAGEVDVVFSMAVLLHVHPSSNSVLAEMMRVAARYVCVIEAETTTLRYIFARDYQRMFERAGARQIRARQITQETDPQVGQDYWGYTARLFAV